MIPSRSPSRKRVCTGGSALWPLLHLLVLRHVVAGEAGRGGRGECDGRDQPRHPQPLVSLGVHGWAARLRQS